MLRVRFKVKEIDYRPVIWPVAHPYWCSGYDSDDWPILVSYVDSIEELMRQWPDAFQLDVEADVEIKFTSRFPKPEWYPYLIGAYDGGNED
jgi:hypothetical protein